MTASTLLDNALALMLTSNAQSPEYGAYALPLVNMLLSEIGIYNNILRLCRDKEALGEPMEITSMSDTLPCEPEFALSALPYGLCAKLLMDDDDMARVAWFQNQYVAAAVEAAGSLAQPVADCYPNGGGV